MTTDAEIRKLMHAELKACHEDFEAMRTRCASAEAALATMIEQKEYFRQCWEAAEAALAERDKPCVWKDDGEYRETNCGELFVFYDGTPVENKCKFCPNCGHPIEVQP